MLVKNKLRRCGENTSDRRALSEPTRYCRPAAAIRGARREDHAAQGEARQVGREMGRLKGLEARMLAAPDQQVSLTDPDARSMATSGRGSGVVGYNVQVAVDTEHHLIVTHRRGLADGTPERHPEASGLRCPIPPL
jgi:hypothetical protein